MAFPRKAVHLVYDDWVRAHVVESTGAKMQQEVSIVIGSGVRGVPLGRPGISGVVPWVPRLLLFFVPSPATPIDAAGGVLRVVPFRFRFLIHG